MNPRTTGILFLVAAALAAFVYAYEIRGGEARREAEEQSKRLFPGIEAEDVAWIELTAQDGTPVRIERREPGWELSEPLVFPADEFAADAMASGVAQLVSESTLEDPQSPEVYGLDAAAAEVRFGDGDASYALRLGDKTPIGANSYATASGSDAIYTVATSATLAFRKQLDDLREKRILDVDPEEVAALELSWPGGGVSLERVGEEWRLTRPLEGPGDDATIDALLSDLSFLRAEGFVDEPPGDAESGLDRPEFSAELVMRPVEEGGEPARQRITIGANLDGSTRLVRAGRPSLYRIRAERLDDFERDPVAYRLRQLAKFSAVDAQRLEIAFHPRVSSTAGEGPVAIEATRGEAGWESTPESFQAGKLSRLVSELSRLRADDILADAAGPDELSALGLSPPSVILKVFGADADAPALAEVHIGIQRGEQGIVARAAGRDTVYALDAALAEHIPVNLEAFRNRFAAEAEAEAGEPPQAEPPQAEPPQAEPPQAEPPQAEPPQAEPPDESEGE